MRAILGTRLSHLLAKGVTQTKGIPTTVKGGKKHPWLLLAGLSAVASVGGLGYYLVIWRPTHTTSQPVLQTAVARRGDIILSASGTGILQPANDMNLSFKSGGTLTELKVKVGDQVKSGQLLAEIDNSSQELAYQEAQQNLTNLTSVSTVGSAQQSVAKAQEGLQGAKLQLEYLISPEVYYWEDQVSRDAQAVKDAQTAVSAAPSDKDAQAQLKRAQAVLDFANDKLKTAEHDYVHDYVPTTFMVTQFNRSTKQLDTYISAPSAAEILKARQDITIAQGALNDAQNLYAALTGGSVSADASGSGLSALLQARSDLQTAKENLAATQLLAPFPGTVIAISAKVGDTVGSTAVITVADLTRWEVQTYMDESDYAFFKVGNQASIVFDALPSQTFSGRVIRVNPSLDTSSDSALVSGLVELDATTADLLVGMGGSVEVIAAQAQNAVIVPIAALHQSAPGKYSVFVVQGGNLEVRDVEVGLQDAVNAEIKSGLQAGEVVSTGQVGTKQQ